MGPVGHTGRIHISASPKTEISIGLQLVGWLPGWPICWIYSNSGTLTVNLEKFLLSMGFQSVPLTRLETGHFRAQGCLNGRSVKVIVDTGAGNTVVSQEVAISLDLDLLQLEESGVGAGGADFPIYEVSGGDFSLSVYDLRSTSPSPWTSPTSTKDWQGKDVDLSTRFSAQTFSRHIPP